MILTVELNRAKESVEIYCDKEGLELLRRRLEVLSERGGHEHLMTPSWAGTELTEELQRAGNTLINHLEIMVKPLA
jgi:hypothetical protein